MNTNTNTSSHLDPEEHENNPHPDLFLLRPSMDANVDNAAKEDPPAPAPLPPPSFFSESLHSSSSSTTAIVLHRAFELHDTVRIRSEVEAVLHEALADVEWSHTLQEQAQARLRVQTLKDAIRAQQYALEETRAIEKQRQIDEAHLADRLVRDLATLSRELDELRAIETQHKALLMQHDEVVAKLLQTEDELAQEKEHRPQAVSTTSSPAPPVAAASLDPPTIPPLEDKNPVPPAATDGAATVTQDNESEVEIASHPAQSPPPVESPSESPAVPTEAASAPADAATAPAAAELATAPAAVVLLLGDHDVDADDAAGMDPPLPQLQEFDETLLMHVFSFLDALDILNTAQVNVSMYSRVDSLFGLGGGGGGGGGGTSSSAHDAVTSSSVSPSTAAATAPAMATSTTTATSTSTNAAPTPVPATPVHSPTLVRLPPPGTAVPPRSVGGGLGQPVLTPSTPSASTATTTTSSSSSSSPSRPAAGGGLSLFSSILQPRGPAKPPTTPVSGGGGGTAAAGASFIPPGVRAAGMAQSVFQAHRRTASADAGTAGTSGGGGGGPPMNAAMANSMASKLSDAELNAIILMTERLKQKESLAERLSRENDALAAQLDGAEAVKDFLISKVRDVEAALSANDDHEAKIARQIASDQEVIAFLDARVQELEGQLESDRIAHEASEIAHQRRLSQLEQKTAVLGDLLQFERERVKENEVDWRSTKRVLVKEVKGLRSQLAALSAERDGYREQNERLRLAVMGPGGGGGSSFFSAGSPSKQQSMLGVRRQGSFS